MDRFGIEYLNEAGELIAAIEESDGMIEYNKTTHKAEKTSFYHMEDYMENVIKHGKMPEFTFVKYPPLKQKAKRISKKRKGF